MKSQYLGCPSDPTELPDFSNAMITTGGGQISYFNNDVLVYTCNPGFTSTVNPFQCMCGVPINPTDTVWLCNSGDFAGNCVAVS